MSISVTPAQPGVTRLSVCHGLATPVCVPRCVPEESREQSGFGNLA